MGGVVTRTIEAVQYFTSNFGGEGGPTYFDTPTSYEDTPRTRGILARLTPQNRADPPPGTEAS